MITQNIKLFLKCYRCSIRKLCSEAKLNSQLLSDYFGLHKHQSDSLLNKHKMLATNHDRLIENLKFLNENGYNKSDILKHVAVLRIHPITLEQHFLFLKESGFTNISVECVHRFRHITNQSVGYLKLQRLMPITLNVAENYKQYLDPLPKDFDVSDLGDDLILKYLHLTVLKRYLCWRLNTSMEVIERTFRIHQVIRNKSFALLCENLALVEELGFPPQRILKYGYLLHNYPKYTKTALGEMRNLAGGDLRESMRIYPKLVMVSPKNYVKIYGILKEFNISDEFIRNAMNVFHLSPETVKLRLQEISSIPELKVLLCHPKIVRLLVHHNRARSRLSFLQQMELKCANILVLGAEPPLFDAHMRGGRDKNDIHGLYTFLRALFKVKEVNKAQWKKHPFHQNVPYVQMEESYGFLRANKYTNAAILKAMHIILYPRNKIEGAIDKMKGNDVLDNKLTQSQKLNLMVYYIEKDYHFTGNGVWTKSAENT